MHARRRREPGSLPRARQPQGQGVRAERDGGVAAEGRTVRSGQGLRAQAGRSGSGCCRGRQHGTGRASSRRRARFPISPPFSISRSPMPARIAELAATADAPVPNGLKGPAARRFPLQARRRRASLLGRSEDALADAELAVSNMPGRRLHQRRQPLRTVADATAARCRSAQARQCAHRPSRWPPSPIRQRDGCSG